MKFSVWWNCIGHLGVYKRFRTADLQQQLVLLRSVRLCFELSGNGIKQRFILPAEQQLHVFSGFFAGCRSSNVSCSNVTGVVAVQASIGSTENGFIGWSGYGGLSIQNSCINATLIGQNWSWVGGLTGISEIQTVTVTNVSLSGSISVTNGGQVQGNAVGYSHLSTINVQSMNCSQSFLNTAGAKYVGFIACAFSDTINISSLNISNSIQLATSGGILSGTI